MHSWNLTPKEAVKLQKELRDKIIIRDSFDNIETVAGADIAFEKDAGCAGVIVYSYPDITEIERVFAVGKLTFPYIPGLLSFRESPLLLSAFAKLKTNPSAVIFDGQGTAHPRRMGIASHMGLWMGIPSIGCAKSRLVGTYTEPAQERGSFSHLKDGDEIIGAVLRTRARTRPVFVSPGHMVSLAGAVEIVMNCADGYRIPKPTREADRFAGCIRANH